MSLPKPNPTTNLSAVTEREFFLVKDHDLDKVWTCMVVYRATDQLTLLLVDHTMNGDLRGTRISRGPQRRWEFMHYLTTDEVVTISGSEEPSREEGVTVPQPVTAAVVDGFDLSGIPTMDQVRASKDASLIPDGIVYILRNREGAMYQCVNCPPGKGYASSGKVRTITVSSSEGNVGWMQIDRTLGEYQWTFVEYADPTKVNKVLRRFIHAAHEDPVNLASNSKYPTEDVILSEGMGVIPDGIFYLALYGTGSEYYSVNCPSRKGYVSVGERTAAQIRRGSSRWGWTRSILRSPRESGWTFIRYLREDEVPAELKRYPKP